MTLHPSPFEADWHRLRDAARLQARARASQDDAERERDEHRPEPLPIAAAAAAEPNRTERHVGITR
jgi:hypothetical protein